MPLLEASQPSPSSAAVHPLSFSQVVLHPLAALLLGPNIVGGRGFGTPVVSYAPRFSWSVIGELLS
jgi:hypothetical protein